MTTTQENIKLLLHDTFVKALIKVRSSNQILSDMYVQILEENENTHIVVYDDADREIIKSNIEGWDEWKESLYTIDTTDAIAGIITDVIFNTDLIELFNDMEYEGPFSLLLVDDKMDAVGPFISLP